jgi:hypothetical protein
MATATRHLNGMSQRAQACLRKAEECERAAALATERRVQTTYRDLAAQWHRMAEHSDDLERRYSASEGRQWRVPRVSGSEEIGVSADKEATFQSQ